MEGWETQGGRGASGWRDRVGGKGESVGERSDLGKVEWEREGGRERREAGTVGDGGREGEEGRGRGKETTSGAQLQATGGSCRYP